MRLMRASRRGQARARARLRTRATKHATKRVRTAAQRTVRNRAPRVEHRKVARSRGSLCQSLGPSSPSTRVATWQAGCRSERQCRRRHAARRRWHMVRWSPSGEAATHRHADGCSRAVRASQRQRDLDLRHRSRYRSWYRYNPQRPQRQLLPPRLRLPACARWQRKRLRPCGPLLAPEPRTALPPTGPKIPLPRSRRHRQALRPPLQKPTVPRPPAPTPAPSPPPLRPPLRRPPPRPPPSPDRRRLP